MTDFALSTNLYTFAQVFASSAFFGWPVSGGEAEVIRTMQPGDLIVPKFAQAADYGSADEAASLQAAYCSHLGHTYEQISAKYQEVVKGGAAAVPFLLRVMGAPFETSGADDRPWASVPVERIELPRPFSTKEFLRLRAVPPPVAAQFKALVSPGRHLQELPQGSAKAITQASAAPTLEPFLRSYSLVEATSGEAARDVLVDNDRTPRPGDRVFVASHAGLLGVHDVSETGGLAAVAPPIMKTPTELVELFQAAALRATSSDNFAPSKAIDAATELQGLLDGPETLIAVDDFARFHDCYVLLAQKVTQALEISKRALPPDAAQHSATVNEDDAEFDELAALAGLSVEAVRAELPVDMAISDAVLGEAVTALRAGKHLLLGGPPGTGKSTLAEALCRAVVKTQFDLATGTADWTTFDTIGGYIPTPDGLAFEPGVVLRALRRGRWLIIDELNRADIDKAFGPLFTLLATSGGPAESRRVVLPYLESGAQVEIRSSDKRSSGAGYFVTPGWRLIGTLNLSDKATLFQLSFAFLRRFAVVDVPLPEESSYRALFEARCEVPDGPARVQIVETAIRLATQGARSLGPAILLDVAQFLSKGLAETASGKSTYADPIVAFVTAVRLFAVPQYEGATPAEAKSVVDLIREQWPDLDGSIVDSLEGALRSVALS